MLSTCVTQLTVSVSNLFYQCLSPIPVSTTTKIHIYQETTDAFILFNATEFTKQTAEH